MNNYQEKYERITNKYNKLIRDAKKYIMNNWESVKDWSELNILMKNSNVINNENKKRQVWFLPESWPQSQEGSRLHKMKTETNPVKTLSIVYDPSDEDMSVTVNGMEFWWIPGDNVIEIADFIEKYLEKKILENMSTI